jgi:glycerate dehydrogenase
MKIYIIGSKEDFTNDQISNMELECSLVFVDINDGEAAYFNDVDEKIIAVDPDYKEWKFTNDEIDRIPNLKAIALNTTGYSWIDVKYCEIKGIVVTNVPFYSTDAVAEYAIFLMMTLARKLPIQLVNNSDGVEYNDKFLGNNVRGKKIGIVGLGHIGNRIAEIGKGLGMEVSYWSRTDKNNEFKYTDLETLFSTSDFIFISLAKNDETDKLITNELLDKIKKDASLISIVSKLNMDKDYLFEKVKNGDMHGLAFESSKVYNSEGLNVMVTKPYAWFTEEALENLFEIWSDTIISLCGTEYKNVVNKKDSK